MRLKGARDAADRFGVPAFLNARTDLFLVAPAAQHDENMVAKALERGRAYADAGADGLFVPGLVNENLIARVVEGISGRGARGRLEAPAHEVPGGPRPGRCPVRARRRR